MSVRPGPEGTISEFDETFHTCTPKDLDYKDPYSEIDIVFLGF